MAGSRRTVTCSRCGRSFLAPLTYDSSTGAPFICNTCRSQPAGPATGAGPSAPPAVQAPTPELGEELLPVCPICGQGRVARARPDRNEHQFICTNCPSVLEETILGYQYRTPTLAWALDAGHIREREALVGKSLTLFELKELSREKAKFVKGKESPATSVPAASPVEAAAPAPATEVAPAPPTAVPTQEEEELFWMVDHEALAERERQQREVKQGVTVDDLLKEIGRDEKKKLQS